jgi:hypothetical protein
MILALSTAGTPSGTGPIAPATPSQAAPQPGSDLDALMARVLERRSETWRALHDYILSERERFELIGPSDLRVYGTEREYTWFVRDGYLVRSPTKIDGVTPDARTREEYEAKWLREEKSREQAEARKAAKQRDGAAAGTGVAGPDPSAGEDAVPTGDDGAGLVGRGLEPRFISEAYFLQFKFDPGNYYLAGRETLEGRQVLRIEYYPKKLFQDHEGENTDSSAPDAGGERSAARAERRGAIRHDREAREVRADQEIERKFNKVALVTLWVDPVERQIVKYTFDNTELNFLPARRLLRLDDISASMTMGQLFHGVWLPRALGVHASVTLANGTYDASYSRQFFDYRQGEVKARIRSFSPREQ